MVRFSRLLVSISSAVQEEKIELIASPNSTIKESFKE
jgi:hypothetical protein